MQTTPEEQLTALQEKYRELLNLAWLMRKWQKEFFRFKLQGAKKRAMQLEIQIDMLLQAELEERDKQPPPPKQQQLF